MFDIAERFIPIKYKTVELIRGELIESDEEFTFYGYMTSSLEHLVNAGIDITNISATVITNLENVKCLKEGYLIDVDGKYIAITKIIKYRDPFSDEYNTFEVLI